MYKFFKKIDTSFFQFIGLDYETYQAAYKMR